MIKEAAMRKTNVRGKRLPWSVDDVICGSAVIMERVCGSSSCRCLKGHKHRSLYVSQYHKGGPRMIYIPKTNEKKVLGFIRNYQIIKSAMRKSSKQNLRRFTICGEKGKI